MNTLNLFSPMSSFDQDNNFLFMKRQTLFLTHQLENIVVVKFHFIFVDVSDMSAVRNKVILLPVILLSHHPTDRKLFYHLAHFKFATQNFVKLFQFEIPDRND